MVCDFITGKLLVEGVIIKDIKRNLLRHQIVNEEYIQSIIEAKT